VIDLHPGCLIAIQRLTMDELGVAEAMAAGSLTSPQRYQNVWLFDIRITGTGRAYRRALDEHVWRDSTLYLNDRFLARCNGLPVIWEHPKGAVLNSAEFADRIVGTTFLPYIKGEDVWAIVKIWDDEAADNLDKEILSTSPSVVLTDVESSKLTLDDGSVLLVEGKPTLLDHIAICPLGVWDKGGDPTGVRVDATKPPGQRQLVRTDAETSDKDGTSNAEERPVAEETEDEKKAREDAARRDADAGQKLDKLLTHVGDAIAKIDAIGSRVDAMEMADKARRDAEEEEKRKDAARRRDAEREPWMEDDAAQCAEDDEAERKDAEEFEKGGDAKELAADKARAKRKDAMRDRQDAATVASEEAKKREDKARKDSQVTDADLDVRVANAIRAHTAQDTPEERDAKAAAQTRADAVYREFGDVHGAPAAMSGESSGQYRRRLLKGLQARSKAWASVDLHRLDDSTLGIAEGQILADAQVAARNPTDLPEDRLLHIRKVDPVTNLTSHEFRGRHTFIFGLKRPSSRVTGVTESRVARQ
jgi:hypothetical protein